MPNATVATENAQTESQEQDFLQEDTTLLQDEAQKMGYWFMDLCHDIDKMDVALNPFVGDNMSPGMFGGPVSEGFRTQWKESGLQQYEDDITVALGSEDSDMIREMAMRVRARHAVIDLLSKFDEEQWERDLASDLPRERYLSSYIRDMLRRLDVFRYRETPMSKRVPPQPSFAE